MSISSGEMSRYYQLYVPTTLSPEETSPFNRRLSLTQIRYCALMKKDIAALAGN
jgi:hypothetical protein